MATISEALIDAGYSSLTIAAAPPNFRAVAETAVHRFGAIQKPTELTQFLELLAISDVDVLVEIGSYAGGTLYAWQQIAPTVITVDLPPATVYAATGEGRQLHGSVLVSGDSHDPATLDKLKAVLAGRLISCLFIDGDHSYSGVKSDFEMYTPLVKPGGVIAFHDIVDHPEQPDIQVSKLWDEIKTPTSIEMIHPDAPWGGIGVLRVSGN